MISPAELSQKSFGDAAAVWFESHRQHIAPRSVDDYRNCIASLKKFFGGVLLREIHIGHFERYQALRSQGECGLTKAGPSRVNHDLNTLAQILARADLWKAIMPLYKPMRLPKTGPQERLSDEAVAHFMHVAESRPKWLRAMLCSIITAHTTAGPGEILQLRLCDVDMKKKIMTVVAGAKNKYRVRPVPLNDTAFAAMEQLLAIARVHGLSAADHFLIPHRARNGSEGFDFTRPATGWYKAMRAICAEASKSFPELARIKPYYWRFHSVTRMLQNGVPIPTVMQIAGHVSRVTTMHYFRPGMDAKREAVAVLDRKDTPPVPAPAAAQLTNHDAAFWGSGTCQLSLELQAAPSLPAEAKKPQHRVPLSAAAQVRLRLVKG
ncbi:MAG: site-specific integrase [Acidobacteriales bacterium]|nr:site-specific integrase [Terriglobales bacterium]